MHCIGLDWIVKYRRERYATMQIIAFFLSSPEGWGVVLS